jgi:hypothetical protein
VTRGLLVLAAVAGVFGACKGKEATKEAPKVEVPPHPVPEPPPVVVPGSWDDCKLALQAIAKVPATRQVATLIEQCKPCGEWTALLDWNKLTEDGGPKRKDIEAAMLGCKAYCDPNAKMRFVGALDEQRGKTNRIPWRLLGDFCKDAVSAVPDARFMSAPYFALDRIARDVAARPDGTKLLEGIELPLPAVSVTGAGLALPSTSVTKPILAKSHLTITAGELRIGPLPYATLGAGGVTVSGEPYPGSLVKLADLAAALAKLPQPVLVFAPKKLPASRLAEILAATKKIPLLLAVTATSTLPGWEIYGTSPVELVGQGDKPGLTVAVGEATDDAVKQIAGTTPAMPPPVVALVLGDKATIESVATVLGALAYKDYRTAVVTVAPTKRPKP